MFCPTIFLLLCSVSTAFAGLDNVTAVVRSTANDNHEILRNVDIELLRGYKYVTLTNCSIPTLRAGNLSELQDVEELGLAGVGLESLGIGSFGGLYKIERLHIIGNNLGIAPGGVFNDHGFRELDLRENHIHTIDDATFRYMDNLRFLDLSNNDISYIDPQAFMDTDNLERIDLSRNRFRGKFPEVIGALWKVQTVDLSHNRIETIEWDSVVGLSRLKRLTLSNNTISTIVDGAFTDLDNLMFLDLFYNNLECLSCNILYSLRNYSSTYLLKNKIAVDCRNQLNEFKRGHPNVYLYY